MPDKPLTREMRHDDTLQTSRNILAVIAIDDYPNPDDRLYNCERDVRAFADVVVREYGFEFDEARFACINKAATRSGIYGLFDRLKENITEGDNLIIYYAGHGWYDKSEDEGFWITYDGSKSSQDKCVSNSEIRRKLNAIEAKHLFFISDSCYSGTLFLPTTRDTAHNYLELHPSRWGLVSGRDKPVLDGPQNSHSPFATALLRHIKGQGHEPLPISILCTKVTGDVGANTDGYQVPIGKPMNIRGHQEGQMVLHPIAAIEAAKETDIQRAFEACKTAADYDHFYKRHPQHARAEEALWQWARLTDTEAAYNRYLRKYETGRWEQDAEDALFAIEDKAAFESAKRRNTVVAYREYLRDYKKGRYRTEAEQLKNELLHHKPTEPPPPAPPPPTPPPAWATFIDMVDVPGGTFEMGDVMGDKEYNDETVHTVTLSSYQIGKYPVTQQQWRDIMGNNPNAFSGCNDCPVENVSWNDAQAFISKLNARYAGANFRLPTEAEWEYAARGGGQKVRFGNGSDIADPAHINFNGSAEYQKSYSKAGVYRKKATPVGSLNSPNALGLHDMSGNVWEWCNDWYGYDYYQTSPQINPQGPDTGSDRVRRGGSWYSYPQYCRVAVRSNGTPDSRNFFIGFRLARTA